MKITRMSLAAVLSMGLFSCASFAADASMLEEAIKGAKFNAFLRYRLQSDSYDNQGGKDGTNDTRTTHQYRAFAGIETAPIKNLSVNVSVLYLNEGATTATGSTGTGLGAGYDGVFGVSTFHAVYAPKDYTKTVVRAGKQIIDTPLTSAGDFDRGTGILITNKDVDGLTLVGALYDTWSLSDSASYGDPKSIARPLVGLGAVYGIANLVTAQLWFFNAKDVANSVLFGKVDYSQDFGNMGARTSIAYGMSTLNTGETFGEQTFAGQEQQNDLLLINGGLSFGPAVFDAGYITNTKPGYSISFDDQGKVINSLTMGQNWHQNVGTGVSIGIARRMRGSIATAVAAGGEDKLSVFHASIGAKNILQSNVDIHLTYAKGNAKYSVDATQRERDFQEIVPLLNYRYNNKLTLQTYYSMLSTDIKPSEATAVTEKRNRYRLQALYRF